MGPGSAAYPGRRGGLAMSHDWAGLVALVGSGIGGPSGKDMGSWIDGMDYRYNAPGTEGELQAFEEACGALVWERVWHDGRGYLLRVLRAMVRG